LQHEAAGIRTGLSPQDPERQRRRTSAVGYGLEMDAAAEAIWHVARVRGITDHLACDELRIALREDAIRSRF
jgi:hypothetical protein